MIHNAGVIRPALLPDVKLDDLDALVNLHLAAAVSLTQAALPAMRDARFGRIVLLSSRAALGLATRTSYSATKAGMIGMARTWALELAPQGITVNVVAPGPIQTDMFHEVIPVGSPKVEQVAAGHPGQTPRPAGRRGARGDVLRRAGEQLRHRAGAVRVRRHQRRQPDSLTPLGRAQTGIQAFS